MIDQLRARPPHERTRLIASLTIFCSVLIIGSAPFVPPASTLGAEVRMLQVTEENDRSAAAALDRILYACAVDRYYFFHDRGYMPYAMHSPLNYYLYTVLEHIGRYHPFFREPSLEHFESAQIIVLNQPHISYPRKGNADEEAIAAEVLSGVAPALKWERSKMKFV